MSIEDTLRRDKAKEPLGVSEVTLVCSWGTTQQTPQDGREKDKYRALGKGQRDCFWQQTVPHLVSTHLQAPSLLLDDVQSIFSIGE